VLAKLIDPIQLPLTTIAEPAILYPSRPKQIEQLLVALLQLAERRLIQVVPSGAITKASMVQLVRRVDPGENLKGVSREEQWPMLHFVRVLAIGAGFIQVNTDGMLVPTKQALNWLQQPRIERVRSLLQGWQHSAWHELGGLEGIRIVPAVSGRLTIAKQNIARLLEQLPDGWLEIDEFLHAVRDLVPDFFREDIADPRWLIRNRFDYLVSGPDNWALVEGLWLRLVISVSWRWLGLTDVGTNEQGVPIAFRLTPLGLALLQGRAYPHDKPDALMTLQPNFEILVPPDCSPYVRFQLNRIAEEAATTPVATYRLTRKSILAALAQGIDGVQIERFLDEYTGQAIPQNVLASLREWFSEYGRVIVREAVLLETDSAETMLRLRHDKRVRLPSAELLGEQLLVVDSGELAALVERIRTAGYGLHVEHDQSQAGDVRLTARELADVCVALRCYYMLCETLDVESVTNSATQRRLLKRVDQKSLARVTGAVDQLRAGLQRRLRDA
jgi:hypothetical protein